MTRIQIALAAWGFVRRDWDEWDPDLRVRQFPEVR